MGDKSFEVFTPNYETEDSESNKKFEKGKFHDKKMLELVSFYEDSGYGTNNDFDLKQNLDSELVEI